MGPQEYQDALDALDAPDAPPPVKAAAKRLVERYSSAFAGAQLKGRSASSLEDQPIIGGPQGLEAMAAGGLTPPPPEQEQIESTIAATHPELSGEQGRKISRALKLTTPPKPSRFQTGEEYQSDPSLPSEWHPPTPANPSTPFDSVWGKLSAVKQAMPDWAGGGTQHFIEPSPEQFMMETGIRALRPLETPEYRIYADQKYAEALAQAQANGRGIVREKFNPAKGAIDAIPGALTAAGQSLNSSLIGADEAITGGVAGTAAYRFDPFGLEGESAPQTWREAKERKDIEGAYSPVAKDVGFALGVLNPNAVGNLAAEGVGLGKAAATIPGALARGAGAGFVGAGATQLASDVPDVLAGDTTAGAAAGRAGNAGMTGILPGAFGAALGRLARNEGESLRLNTPLGEAEKGGARLGAEPGFQPGLPGFQKGRINEGLEARARRESIGAPDKPDVESMLASDLREPFTKRVHAREGELKAQAGPLREFEEVFAHEQIPLPHTIQAIMDARRKLVLSDGTISDPAAMKQLDELLGKAARVQPQAPEQFLQPKNEQLLHQLERADNIQGDLGTPESFREGAERIRKEIDTPTRPITPQAEEMVQTRGSRDTQYDLGPFEENLPDMKGSIEAGMAGERLRSLHEARAANPHTFDITPKEAAERGLDVGLSGEGAEAVPNFARISPSPRNPEDIGKLSAALEREHKSGSVSEQPFPGFDKIKRALHQDRDAFRGETGAIKQEQTFQLDNGETVRGYSAGKAQLADDISKFENLLDLLGLKKMPAADESAMLQSFESKARGFGKGGRSPAVDEAFRQMGTEAGATPTLEQMVRYRKMLELKQRAKLGDAVRFWSHPEAARLRLDPALQALIPYLENAGSLGALPNQIEDNNVPPMADQATLEEIRRALQP